MTRAAKILFGSFSEQLNVPIYSRSNDWWLFRASAVELEGRERVSHRLAGAIADCAAALKRPAPAHIDFDWFGSVAPIALQLNVGALEQAALPLGFVACRVQDDRPSGGPIEDIAYPFLFDLQDLHLSLVFSALGPTSDIRQQIAVAFGTRLLE